MLKFIARRLLVLLFVFFVLTVILFWMHIRLTEFEADRLVRDYFYFTSSIVRGNFGISTSSKLPVIYELKTYLPSTLELIFFSFILSFVAGTVAGIAAGLNHHSMLLKGTTTMLRLTTSFPVFWLGQMMITIFAVELKILPTAGNISLFCDVPQVTGSIFIDSILTMDPACIKSMLDHLVLPVIVLSFMPATQFFLLARRASFTISEMDFIRMAISRGQSQFSLARKHIFLNIIPSILPKVKIILCNLFSATILVEVVFEWPGTGIWISNAVEHSDNAVLETAIFVLAIIFLLVNTVIDIMGEVFFPEKRRITLNI
ncbi:ABC transporter permease [Succinimonas sp.]|uniref:ABC transporter permease n=1 Tax=Succinimonas sp. TaxID=1936151 RepID=UPI0038667443